MRYPLPLLKSAMIRQLEPGNLPPVSFSQTPDFPLLADMVAMVSDVLAIPKKLFQEPFKINDLSRVFARARVRVFLSFSRFSVFL